MPNVDLFAWKILDLYLTMRNKKYIFWLATFFMYKVNFSANQFEIHQMYCMKGLSIRNWSLFPVIKNISIDSHYLLTDCSSRKTDFWQVQQMITIIYGRPMSLNQKLLQNIESNYRAQALRIYNHKQRIWI